jgi:hypothetical protein
MIHRIRKVSLTRIGAQRPDLPCELHVKNSAARNLQLDRTVAVLTRSTLSRHADDEAALDNPLTTKEGWRRFVDKTPEPPILLASDALARLGAAERVDYDEARIDYHADLPLVNTPIIRQVVATSRLLIQLNRHQVSARRGVVISGASGTGKTAAVSNDAPAGGTADPTAEGRSERLPSFLTR